MNKEQKEIYNELIFKYNFDNDQKTQITKDARNSFKLMRLKITIIKN